MGTETSSQVKRLELLRRGSFFQTNVNFVVFVNGVRLGS